MGRNPTKYVSSISDASLETVTDLTPTFRLSGSVTNLFRLPQNAISYSLVTRFTVYMLTWKVLGNAEYTLGNIKRVTRVELLT